MYISAQMCGTHPPSHEYDSFLIFCLQTQADETEQLIKDEFEKLHKFLYEEEAARLTALREEEERKAVNVREKLEDICKQVEELSAIIRDADATMNGSDIQFLKVCHFKWI